MAKSVTDVAPNGIIQDTPLANPSVTSPDEVVESPASAESNASPIPDQEKAARAEKIVKSHIYWSMGVGAIPIPIVDFLGIGALQLRMVKQISEVYGVPFSEHAARNIISVLVGTVGGGVVTKLSMISLIKTLPFAGAVVGGLIALPAIAGASTYALGKVFVNHFEKGGDLLNLSPEKMKGYFATQYEAGKKVASDVFKRSKPAVAAAEAPAPVATPETTAA